MYSQFFFQKLQIVLSYLLRLISNICGRFWIFWERFPYYPLARVSFVSVLSGLKVDLFLTKFLTQMSKKSKLCQKTTMLLRQCRHHEAEFSNKIFYDFSTIWHDLVFSKIFLDLERCSEIFRIMLDLAGA